MRSLSIQGDPLFQDSPLLPDIASKLQHRMLSSQEIHLLPKLTRLVWMVQSDSEIATIVPFIPPTLEDLELLFIGFGENPQFKLSLIKNIGVVAPQLRRLRLVTVGSPPEAMGDHLAGSLRQLTRLSSLRLAQTDVTDPIWGGVAACPTIRKLEVGTRAEEAGLAGFAEKLMAACPLVERLTIQVFSLSSSANGTLSFQPLLPLLQCKALRTLRIVHPRLVRMDNEHIQAMGRSWPKLEELDLCSGMNGSVQVGNGLETLGRIAESGLGSRLVELHQYFDTASAIPKNVTARFPKLQTLDFGFSILQAENEARLADFLTALLPQDAEVKWYNGRVKTKENWQRLEEMVTVGQLARAEAVELAAE